MKKGIYLLFALFCAFNVFSQDNILETYDHKYYSIDVPKGFKEHIVENTRPIWIGCLNTVEMVLHNKNRAKTYLENWYITIERVKLNQNYTVQDEYRSTSESLAKFYDAITKIFKSPYGDLSFLSTYEASNPLTPGGKEKMKNYKWLFKKENILYSVEFLYNSDKLKNEKKTLEVIKKVISSFKIKEDPDKQASGNTMECGSDSKTTQSEK